MDGAARKTWAACIRVFLWRSRLACRKFSASIGWHGTALRQTTCWDRWGTLGQLLRPHDSLTHSPIRPTPRRIARTTAAAAATRSTAVIALELDRRLGDRVDHRAGAVRLVEVNDLPRPLINRHAYERAQPLRHRHPQPQARNGSPETRLSHCWSAATRPSASPPSSRFSDRSSGENSPWRVGAALRESSKQAGVNGRRATKGILPVACAPFRSALGAPNFALSP